MSFRGGALDGQQDDDDDSLVDDDSGSSSLGADVEVGAKVAGRKEFGNEDDDDGIYADDGSGSSVESAHREDYMHATAHKGSEKSNSDDGIYDDDESGTGSDKGPRQEDKYSSDGIFADDDSGSSSNSSRKERAPESAGASAERDAEGDREEEYEDDFSRSETEDRPQEDKQLPNSDSQQKNQASVDVVVTLDEDRSAAARQAGEDGGEEGVVTESHGSTAALITIESDQATRPPTEGNIDTSDPVTSDTPSVEAAAPSDVVGLAGNTDSGVETPEKSETSVQVCASAETTPEIPAIRTPLVSVTVAERDRDAAPRSPGKDGNEQSHAIEKEQHSAKQAFANADQVSIESTSDSKEVLQEGGTQQPVSRTEESAERGTERDDVAKRLQEHFLGTSEDEDKRSAGSVAGSHEQEEDEVDTEPAPAATSHEIVNVPHAGSSDEDLSEQGEQGVFAEAQDATRTEGMNEESADEASESATPNFVDTEQPQLNSAEGIVYVGTEEARSILGLDSAGAHAEEPSAGASVGLPTNLDSGDRKGTRTKSSSGKMPGARRPGSSWVEYRTRVNPEVSRGSSARKGTRRKDRGRRGQDDTSVEGGKGSRAQSREGRDDLRTPTGRQRSRSRGSDNQPRPAWNSRLFLPARSTSEKKHEHIMRWVPHPSQGRAESADRLQHNHSFEYPNGVSSEPSGPALGEKSRTRVGTAKEGVTVARSKSSLAFSTTSSSPPGRRPATSMGTSSPSNAHRSPHRRRDQFHYNTEGVRGGVFGSGSRRPDGGCRRTTIDEQAEASAPMPGPTSYEIMREDSTPQNGGVMGGRHLGPGSLDWSIRSSASQPGPSHYDAEGKERRRIVGGNISTSRLQTSLGHAQNNRNPGPGDYDPGPSQPRRVLGTVLKDSQNPDFAKIRKTPGPGQYDLPPLGRIRGGGFGGASRLADRRDDRNLVPGPGSYTVGNTLTEQSSQSIGVRYKSTPSFGHPTGSGSTGIRPMHEGHRVTILDQHIARIKNFPGPATYNVNRHEVARKVEQKPMVVGRGNWPTTQSRGWTDPVVYKFAGDTCSMNADRRAIHSLQRNWEVSAQQFAAMLKAAGLPDPDPAPDKAPDPDPEQLQPPLPAEPSTQTGDAAAEEAAAESPTNQRSEEAQSAAREDAKAQKAAQEDQDMACAAAGEHDGGQDVDGGQMMSIEDPGPSPHPSEPPAEPGTPPHQATDDAAGADTASSQASGAPDAAPPQASVPEPPQAEGGDAAVAAAEERQKPTRTSSFKFDFKRASSQRTQAASRPVEVTGDKDAATVKQDSAE